jgi:hypothetical protein
MKSTLNLWLTRNLRVHGVLAGGIRYPDHSAFSQSLSDAFGQSACDNAMRVLTDVFKALHANRLPSQSTRLSFQDGTLHAVRRSDGACLGIFTLRDSNDYDADELARILNAFLTVAVERE